MYLARKSGKHQRPPVDSAATGGSVKPRRLFIFDRVSGTKYLVGTGLDVSVRPPINDKNTHIPGVTTGKIFLTIASEFIPEDTLN